MSALLTKSLSWTWSALKSLSNLKIIFEDPVFRTKYSRINTALTIVLYLLLVICTIDILCLFCQAWQKAPDPEAKDKVHTAFLGRRMLRSRARALSLLLFGLAAFLLVNILRYRHRDLKLLAYRSIEAWRETEDVLGKEKEILDYLPDKVDVKKKLYEYAYGRLPPALVDRFSLPADWSWNSGAWDYFRLLVDDGRRNWWTRQWFMGYLAWALWVAVECENREITGHAASFLILGYCFSLSGVQAVSYGVFLMWPQSQDGWYISPSVVRTICITAGQVVVLVLLSFSIHWIPNGSHGSSWHDRAINCLQGLLILIPFFNVWQWTGEWVNSYKLAKKQLSKAYFALSVCSTVLYAYSSYWAFREANPEGWLGKANRWGGQLSWFIPWRVEKHFVQSEQVGSWLAHLLYSLGDHPWINAVGWDVICSLFGLLAWSVVGSADVRTMLQCSVMPWLGDVEDAGRKVPRRASETLENAAEVAEDFLETAQEKTEGLARATRHGMDQVKEALGRALEQVEDMAEQAGYDFDLGGRSSQRRRNTRSTSSRGSAKSGDTQNSRRSHSSAREGLRSSSTRPSRRRQRPSFGARAVAWLKKWLFITSAEQGGLSGGYADLAGKAVDIEAAAVTWVLWILGGLGAASAGVFGADQI